MAKLLRDGVIQLHQSHLSQLYKCGIAFAFEHIQGLHSPTTSAMVVGSAFHAAVRAITEPFIGSGEFAPVAAGLDALPSAVEKELAYRELQRAPEEIGVADETIRGSIVNEAQRLVSLAHRHMRDAYSPGSVLAVEQPWVISISFPETVSDKERTCEAAGRFDVVTDLGLDDWKTAAKSPTEGAIEEDLQMMVYAYGRRKAPVSGATIERPVVRKHTAVKTKTPQLVSQGTIYGAEIDGPVQTRYRQALRVIESGDFQPANPSDWWCGNRCPFYDRCPVMRRKVTK